MKFHINKLYIWFQKGDAPRVINFDNNKVNVITGDASKGKSSIWAIIDYCLLSSEPQIVTPIVNESAEWYGLEFEVGEKYYSIARCKPTSDMPDSKVILYREPFPEDFYPVTSNVATTDARTELNLAFNITEEYKNPHIEGVEDARVSFRSFFIYNALTERIMSDSKLFTDFAFFEKAYVGNQDVRNYLFDIVLGLDNVQNNKYLKKLNCLQKKQKAYNDSTKRIKSRNKEFSELIAEIVPEYSSNELLKNRTVTQMSIDDWISLLEETLSIYTPQKPTAKSKEVIDLEQEYDQKSLQYLKICEARKAYQEYIQSQDSIIDSLKPLEYLQSKAAQTGKSIWTTLILNAFEKSLNEIREEKNKAIPEAIDEERIIKLKADLHRIETELGVAKRIEEINASAKAGFYYLIGKSQSYLNRLKKIKGRLDKITVESLSNEELIEMETLASKISDFTHNRSSYKSELNQCMQEIFNGLNFMENYSKCKIAYRADDEMVVLRFPNSSYDEGQIGSQSNYMFLHLCYFLGMHKYMVSKGNKYIGQFLFIDQPSIPYYEGDSLTQTTDRAKLMDAFKAINDFMGTVINEFGEEFQIILIEHASEDHWTGENQLDYFKTIEKFVEGNALIPQGNISNRN